MFPVLFISTGGPSTSVDNEWLQTLHRWAQRFPRPKAILAISAHYLHKPIAIAATKTVPLLYDFSGFPTHYYSVQYPAPGAPELATRVKGLLRKNGFPTIDDPHRGLDHGIYPALMGLYPGADVPVLLISLPSEDPEELFRLGEILSQLRDDTLIVTTGYTIHNFSYMFSQLPTPLPGEEYDQMLARAKNNPPTVPKWAKEFDAWVKETLVKRDWQGLLQYRKLAPGVRNALPTQEHFVPLIVAAGAGKNDKVTFMIEGFDMMGSSVRSVQFG